MIKEKCKKLCKCNTKYEWNNNHKNILKINNSLIKYNYYKKNYEVYFEHDIKTSLF